MCVINENDVRKIFEIVICMNTHHNKLIIREKLYIHDLLFISILFLLDIKMVRELTTLHRTFKVDPFSLGADFYINVESECWFTEELIADLL